MQLEANAGEWLKCGISQGAKALFKRDNRWSFRFCMRVAFCVFSVRGKCGLALRFVEKRTAFQ